MKRILCIGLVLLLASCAGWDTLRVFEQHAEIPGNSWNYKLKPSFEVAITDTSSLYNLYVTIRHTEAYRYSNLFLLITSQYPNESPKTSRVELPLADPDGRWLGSGMDDIFSHRVLILQNAALARPGIYRFTFEQDMRQNPLPHILSVGIRIEKAGPRNL